MKAPSIKFTILAAICALGIVGLVQAAGGWVALDRVTGHLDFMTGNALPTMEKIANFRDAYGHARSLLGEEVLADTPTQRQMIDKAVLGQLAEFDQNLADYKPLIVDEGDQNGYDAVVASYGAWKNTVTPIEKSVLDGDLGGATRSFGLQSAAAEALDKALDALSDDKVHNADDDTTAALASIGFSKIAAVVLCALMLMAVIVTLVVVLRRVLGPLGQITAAMRSIVGGDLDIVVPGLKRKDEIGDMAQAVESFRGNGLKIRALSEEERLTAEQTAARAAESARMGQSLSAAVTQAGRGDFSMRVETGFSQENLNSLAEIVNKLLATVEQGLGETDEVLEAVADTDLTRRVEGDFEGAFLRLKTSTNAVADKLSDIVMQLKGTSGSLKLATGEILSGANDLSERTTKQAATIEETSAAMEQLASTVLQNAKRANDASEVAATVTRTAEEGGQVMSAANDAMERITASSGKISNIIGLIDDIAFQTNLLALNASVEAARAGEAGKGFAVVAVEVRRLAQSAAEASKEIKVLIDQSGNEVAGGSKLVADAASKLSTMLVAARSSNELMSSIARESREQASAIEEVTTAVRQMDEMTQHNAALVEEINAAIEQTESQATELDRIVDVFNLSDSGPATAKHMPAATPRPAAARPALVAVKSAPAAAKPGGIRALQAKATQAAKSYLSRGPTATKADDWSEF